MVRQTVLLVEDEPLIALMIEGFISELGWGLSHIAYNEAEALRILEVTNPLVAILDINIGPTTSLAIAARCSSIEIPVIFMTGYDAGDIPGECGNAPVLSKPFSSDDLDVVLRRVVKTSFV